MCRALEPPYSGPYQLLSRKDKRLQLLKRCKPVTVLTDRVKAAYIFIEADFRNTFCNPVAKATSTTDYAASSYPNYVSRSPHPLPHTLQHLSNHLRQGGGVMCTMKIILYF
jgi:hypothetical protein